MDKTRTITPPQFLDIFEAKIIFIIVITSLVIAAVVFTFMSFRNHQSLEDFLRVRTEIIMPYIETVISGETFSRINDPGDMETPLYQEARYELDRIHDLANLKQLYTIKRNNRGTLVYVIDGQDPPGPDFYYPGRPLEEDLWEEAESALEGRPVFKDDIRNSRSGPVYTVLWPFTDNGLIAGGIIMEYDAVSLPYGDRVALVFSVLAVFCIILLLSIFASIAFKGISRPFYKKMAYTDVLTGLNNRTAFELDRKRLQGNLKNYTPLTMLMFDLNNLKEVNDTLGHTKGDLYLVTAARLIQKHFGSLGECYRIGGDEFCIVSTKNDPEDLRRIMEEDFAQETDRNRGIIKSNGIDYFAIAYGMAVYDQNIHRDLYEVFVLADERMYAKKRQMKMKTKTKGE